MNKVNNKGFTVIELILSFILVMFLAVGMFALVNNYRTRQQNEVVVRDLSTLKNTLIQDIYEDVLNRKVNSIEYCRDDDNNIIAQCININFKDSTTKKLEIIVEETETEEDGTKFKYETFSIMYDKVKYKNPDPKFAKIVSDYILIYSEDEDELEYGKLYKIQIIIAHQDIEDKTVIEVVTTGIN